MPESKQEASVALFDVTNIGGIDETAVDIPPGVTVLTGKNATNRTSFLQSIMAAMGSTQATLKGDADEGSVALTYGDEVYERTLTRAGDAVQFDGEGYLDDPEVADLFAFLLETNEARRSVARGDDLRDERDALVDELTDKRTKIDQIEANAVDEFNEHMDAILGILEYENLERIWIERVEQTVREGRQKVDRTVFELHIVRTTENGAAYEDTIEHLSESEREVTGLIFALAGYLVHDLQESVPFMLLDSLEAIDSARIAELVEYFADYAEHLVVALLPEDAQALDDDLFR